jgi:UDP-glucose 4-epimerase
VGRLKEAMMKLLVTGGTGYVGAVVVAQLVAAGHDVTVVDDLSTGHVDTVPPQVTFHRLGIHDVANVLTAAAGFDGVLHFAAKIAAGESVQRPELYWHTNLAGSLVLLEAVRAAAVPRLVFSSTAAVYGNPVSVPIAEEAAVAPTNPYGWTKLAVDAAIGHACAAHGLGGVSLRYFNVAGAALPDGGPALGERHEPETHLIPIALEVAAGRREKLQIFGDDYPTPDGSCVRDYIHVEDLAAAHLLAVAAAEPGRHKVYNLGNGNGFSNKQVVKVVRAVTGAPVPVSSAPRRPGDPAELVASSARAKAELGWVPAKPDLHDIVADAWTFFRTRGPAA